MYAVKAGNAHTPCGAAETTVFTQARTQTNMTINHSRGHKHTLAFSETLRALHLYSLYTQRSTAGGHSYYNYSLVLTGSQCSFQINYAIMDSTTSVVQALMGFSSHPGLGLKTLYIDPHAVHETLVAV